MQWSLSGAVAEKRSSDVWKDKKHKIKSMENELLLSKHEGLFTKTCCYTIAKWLLRSHALRNQKLGGSSKAHTLEALWMCSFMGDFEAGIYCRFNFTLMTHIHWRKMRWYKWHDIMNCSAASPEWEQAVLITNLDIVTRCALESLNVSVGSRHLNDIIEQENVI